MTGAIAGGRIDVAVVAILLPQVLRAGVDAVRRRPARGAWRRSIGAGLLLAVTVAFAPILWLIAVAGVRRRDRLPRARVGASARGDRRSVECRRGHARRTARRARAVELAPAGSPAVAARSAAACRSSTPRIGAPSGVALALLRAGGVGAAADLDRHPDHRGRAARPEPAEPGRGRPDSASALLIVGVGVAVALTRNAGVTAGRAGEPALARARCCWSPAPVRCWRRWSRRSVRGPRLRGQSFGWRQPAAVGVVGLALVSTVVLRGGWVIRGRGRAADRARPAGAAAVHPVRARQCRPRPARWCSTTTGPAISYALVRRPSGPQLGDADTAPARRRARRRLGSRPRSATWLPGRPGAGDELAPFGIAVRRRVDRTPRVGSPRRSGAPRRYRRPGAGRHGVAVVAADRRADRCSARPLRPGRLRRDQRADVARVLRRPQQGRRTSRPGRRPVGWWCSPSRRTATGTPRSTASRWRRRRRTAGRRPSWCRRSGGRLRIGYSGGRRDLWLVGELVGCRRLSARCCRVAVRTTDGRRA